MVFNRALASSVGTLTSRAVTLVYPERFLGNNLQRVCNSKVHFKTSLAQYWGWRVEGGVHGSSSYFLD